MSPDTRTVTERRISDFCQTGSGGTPSRTVAEYFGGAVPWVKSGELRESVITETEEHLTAAGLENSAAKLLPPDTLLVALYGATVGRIGVLGIQAATNQAVCHIIPNKDAADVRYLFYALRSKVPYWLNKRVGGGQPNISQGVIKDTFVPLPPLAEQKRIAGILDAADALRAKRREALAQLDTLLQATFLDMFGCGRPPISIGPVQFGRSTNFVPLSTMAVLATGHTPDRGVPQYWGGDTPWISLTDIRRLDGTIAMETGENVTDEGLENSSSIRLPGRTVCLSRTASVGFVTVMGREMATSQDFVNWMCGERLDPIYLMWALRTSKPYLLSKASGSTHKTIYYRHAEQFEVYLPPIADQKRFASVVEAVEGEKRAHRAHRAELDTLFASLQTRAFRGEL